MSEENDQIEEQEANAKNMSDRSHEVGRDGAYLEIDAKELVESYNSGDLEKASILVIKSPRIELSDPLVVASVIKKVKDLSGTKEVEGMTDEQVSFYIILNALVSGFQK
jgi:hypothetical protein